MASIGSTPRPSYIYDSDNSVWIPIGVADHSHADYATLPSQENNQGKYLTTDGTSTSWGTIPYKPEFNSTVSSNIIVSNGGRYFVNTSAPRTLTLPASASIGDEIQIFDVSGLSGSNNITVASNGLKMNGEVQDLLIDINNAAVILVYTGSAYGWRVA